VPNVALELHGRRHERVVLGEFELGREDAAFVGCSFGALDHGFPEEEVVFVDGAGGDALWWVGGEVFVLLEETFRSDGVHGCGGLSVFREMFWDLMLDMLCSLLPGLRGLFLIWCCVV
jgi:hypothetical protein